MRRARSASRDTRIILRHILPNIAHLIIITFALSFTALVLSETILSYLGIGLDGQLGPDDRPGAQRALAHADHLVEPRGRLDRCSSRWCWRSTSIADAMRDIVDPRTRREGQ